MRFSDTAVAPVHTLACKLRDYPGVAPRAGARYGVWTIPVDCPHILTRLRHAQQHLGGWLHTDYRRQAHVTLFVCGFPSQLTQFDDDFPGERLAAQLEALQQFDPAAFELQIGGLDSFASAPFLTVSDPLGQLEPLRRILAIHSPEVRQSPYMPHLTVGLYAHSVPGEELVARMGAFVDRAPLTLAVSELHYSSYAASDLAGPLRTETCLRLASASSRS